MRELMRAALEVQAGWQVTAVESGADALAQAAADTPQAILLDSIMPELDGAATLARLRADPRTTHVPVIMVTADDQPQASAEFERLGAVGIIHKPFAMDRLAGQVTELIGAAA
jgi:CheY-like chemotaxis protein